jgi:hypothetical protein
MSDDAFQMILDCEKREEKLSEWELCFIQSISERISTRSLTPNQIEILNRIWDKVT